VLGDAFSQHATNVTALIRGTHVAIRYATERAPNAGEEADVHGSDIERVTALASSSEAEVRRKMRGCQKHRRTREAHP
jgi:hypothetical protein